MQVRAVAKAIAIAVRVHQACKPSEKSSGVTFGNREGGTAKRKLGPRKKIYTGGKGGLATGTGNR